MAGTYTKAIIVKNQNHIKNFYKGNGGMTAFVEQVNDYRDAGRTRYGLASPYGAIAQMVFDGVFYVYREPMRAYLHKLGLTDDKKIDKFTWQYNWDGVEKVRGVEALYAALLARDGAKLYEDWVRKH